MEKLIKTQTFQFSAEQCFGNLLKVFTHLEMTVQSQSAESQTIISYYKIGKAETQVTIEAKCSHVSKDSAYVNIIYRPDLTSWQHRPIFYQSKIEEKMNLILAVLAQFLEPLNENEQIKAIKLEILTNKWLWFDWMIFIVICLSVKFILFPDTNLFEGMIYMFGFGAILGLIYHLTLRRIWVKKFPHLYKIFECSKCKSQVTANADTCPTCKALFMKQTFSK